MLRWGFAFGILGATIELLAQGAIAQVVSDGSIGTIVNPNGMTYEITGGTTAGQNLFHSFDRFNIPTGGVADFQNDPSLVNLFSRVTGGLPAEIDGVISSKGATNFFLLSPAGILFGPNASLDVGGSFVATTANAIQFDNKDFFNLKNSPVQSEILTINPSAFLFDESNNQMIINQSTKGLQVPNERSLVLLGGDIHLDRGVLFAPNGDLEIGGLAEKGAVLLDIINDSFSLRFPENSRLANLSLSNGAIATTNGKGGGKINIEANHVKIDSESLILANTLDDRNGNGIVVNASTLELNSASVIESSTFGAGNAGEVLIHVKNLISLIGKETYIGSVVTESAIGNGGNVTILTRSLIARDGGQILLNTAGKGSVGELTLNASNSIELIGTSADSMNSSALFARAQQGADGNAGNIVINTPFLLVKDGAQISTRSRGRGSAGDLTINAFDSMDVIGTLTGSDMRSRIIAVGFSNSKGGGKLTINTKKLSIQDGAIAVTSTFGGGSAGQLTVNASEFVKLIGISKDGRYRSALTAETSGRGNAANLVINTKQLIIQDGAAALTTTFSSGKAGNLIVNATELVDLKGISFNGKFRSALGAETFETGNAGTLEITTENLMLQNGSVISALTEGLGGGGDIEIKSGSLTLGNESLITSLSSGSGNAGNLRFSIRETLLADNSEISTSAVQSSGGTISITAKHMRLLGNSDIKTNISSNMGNGGNISLKAQSVIALNDSDILAFASEGRGGDVTLNTRAFFGQSYRPAPFDTDLRTLDGNDRVDINATGAVSGVITLPDTNFIQNSLTQLPNNQIDTNKLLAQTCLIRQDQPEGTFYITGTGSIPNRPHDPALSNYPTNTIQPTIQIAQKPWKLGDPIIEPQGFYKLANGRLVMSRECSQ